MPTNQQRREAAKRKLARQMERRREAARRRKIIGVGVTVGVVVIVAGLAVYFVTTGNDDNTAASAPSSSATAPPPINNPTQRVTEAARSTPLPNPTTCDYPATPGQQAAKPVKAPDTANIPSTGTVNVTFKSTAGDIPLTLDRSLAPCTVNSFLSLVQQNYYTGTSCHRLGTQGLQILQCGDPTGSGSGGPGYSFKDETFPELTYGRGILAMANAGPDTNGSQFFMVYGDAQLPPDYTVFGSISDAGLQVLDKVARDGIDPASEGSDGTGAPLTPVTFTAVSIDS